MDKIPQPEDDLEELALSPLTLPNCLQGHCAKTWFHLSVLVCVCPEQTHCSACYLFCLHGASLSRERLVKTDPRLKYWLTGRHLITVRTHTFDEWVYGAADKRAGKRKGHGYRGQIALVKEQRISCMQISALSHFGLDRGQIWETDRRTLRGSLNWLICLLRVC